MQQVKTSSLKLFKELQATADSEGKAKTDIIKFTTRVQSHIITSVLIGEEEAFDKLTFYGKNGEEIMDSADFIDSVLIQFFDRVQENIPGLFFPSLFLWQITKTDRDFFKNCDVIRSFIKSVIERRKKGLTGGISVEGN